MLLFLPKPVLAQDQGATKVLLHERFREQGNDFSGVARVPGTDRFLVIDDSCKLLEFTITPEKISIERALMLNGLDDCEAIVVLPSEQNKQYRVAVTEERRGNVAVFSLKPTDQEVDCARDCRTYPIDNVSTFWRPNSGLEGMALVAFQDVPVLYIAKEEYPKRMYRVELGADAPKVSIPWDAQQRFPIKGDIAGLTFFEGNLWVLDERLEQLYEVSLADGHLLNRWSLPASGFWDRHEGLAVSRSDAETIQIVMVSERHSVYLLEVHKSA